MTPCSHFLFCRSEATGEFVESSSSFGNGISFTCTSFGPINITPLFPLCDEYALEEQHAQFSPCRREEEEEDNRSEEAEICPHKTASLLPIAARRPARFANDIAADLIVVSSSSSSAGANRTTNAFARASGDFFCYDDEGHLTQKIRITIQTLNDFFFLLASLFVVRSFGFFLSKNEQSERFVVVVVVVLVVVDYSFFSFCFAIFFIFFLLFLSFIAVVVVSFFVKDGEL